MLARKRWRVLAVDLAGGLLMSQALMATPEFASGSSNRIEQREGQRIPANFPGALEFDYAVLDTDDSFTVGEDLLLANRPGWRVISPINPHDPVGLSRIPGEIRAVATATLLSPSELRISIVANMAFGGDIADGCALLRQALHACGIEKLLVNTVLPFGTSKTPPHLLDDDAYAAALENLQGEIGL